MPLIEKTTQKIQDPRFASQLDRLEHRNQFIRELATVILADNSALESVLSIANRVYDRHCAPREVLPARRRPDQTVRMSA